MAIKKRSKRVNVLVESVHPFSDAQQRRLFEKIKEILGSNKVQIQFALNPDLLGGLTVKINDQLLDLSHVGFLGQFQREMESYKTGTQDLRKMEMLFQSQIQSFMPIPDLTEVGHVLSVSDGVARVSGLDALMAGECVRFSRGMTGMALNLNANTTDVLLFEKADVLQEGDHAFATHKMNTIPVGFSLLGRVLNPLGDPLDNKESFVNLDRYPIFAPAPGIVDRDKVRTPLHTGIKAIDSLVPIGRGQRELIIGDRQTGKTTLILDTILSQRYHNEKVTDLKDKVFCVYVAIGQKQSTVRDVMRILQENGAMDYTVIVSASASSNAVMQYLAPYAGCAIGEYFRDHGMHAVVFYDDLSKHAVAYREMSLLLKRPSGREAYPGDVFYLHSKLLERAAQLSSQIGGGSLTAIPVVETLEGDVSAYIPTNVISITDGQIYLDSTLFHQGVRPAVNVGLSVSRVGSAAQNKAMKQLAGSLKLELSQYREVLSFAQLASDLDSTTQKLLSHGTRLTEVMKQRPYHPLTVAQELLSLFVGVKGYLDDLSPEQISDFLSGLLKQVKLQETALMLTLEKGNLTEETILKLDTLIRNYIEHRQEKM